MITLANIRNLCVVEKPPINVFKIRLDNIGVSYQEFADRFKHNVKTIAGYYNGHRVSMQYKIIKHLENLETEFNSNNEGLLK